MFNFGVVKLRGRSTPTHSEACIVATTWQLAFTESLLFALWDIQDDLALMVWGPYLFRVVAGGTICSVRQPDGHYRATPGSALTPSDFVLVAFDMRQKVLRGTK